jgi:hypothetical protein
MLAQNQIRFVEDSAECGVLRVMAEHYKDHEDAVHRHGISFVEVIIVELTAAAEVQSVEYD